MKINAALAGILTISGAPWWATLLCIYTALLMWIVLPRNSKDLLAWWTGYWNRPRRNRHRRH
ncbi:hypothetical protein [Streptomyces sp. RKAG293]|uniref:hypothetical protein n=1 Tax=Streptomyces sp. RKAG293 TaxID=2893403 RepID=UPI002033CE91|nr:hypothetical protein [Streptomyces sp. RKAG293]MCM2424296.1 hypothetical protein [Streptomyces sp. RKAG293]